MIRLHQFQNVSVGAGCAAKVIGGFAVCPMLPDFDSSDLREFAAAVGADELSWVHRDSSPWGLVDLIGVQNSLAPFLSAVLQWMRRLKQSEQ